MGTATDNSLSTQAGTGIKQDNGANALSTKAGTEVNKDEERRLMAQAGGATAPGFVAATTTAIVGPELSNGAQVVQDLDAGIQNFRGRNGSPDLFVKPDGANH